MCYAPENSLAAFRKAIELGTYRIEFDVRRCATGELVVIHDATVDRTSNGSGQVSGFTLAELRALALGDAQRISTLDEVFAELGTQCRWLVELKETGLAADVVGTIRRFGLEEACTLSSFHEDELVAARELGPRIAIAYFLTEPKPFDAAEVIRRPGASLLIIWPRAATPERTADAKRHGMHVRCGFGDSMTYEESFAIFRNVVGMGVDEISCGRPDWIARMAGALE
jgi:glycerophosphoryl diester phosphodiesterase